MCLTFDYVSRIEHYLAKDYAYYKSGHNEAIR